MRGLLLVGTRPPPSGGIAAHLDDVARAVRARGGRVRFADVRPGSSRSAAGLGLLSALVAGRARGELLHLHTNCHNAGSWRLAHLVAVVSRGDAFLTVHSGFAPEHIAAHAVRCGAIASRYRRVIAVSEPIARALRDHARVDAKRLLCTPAFSVASLPLVRPPAGLGALRRRHATLLASALGRGPEYGAGVLLQAFHALASERPDIGLVLFGPASREPALEPLLRSGPEEHRSRIHRLGDLDRGEALGVIAAADVFLRPTLTDGDAVSVREALALGRRVVASDASPRPDGVRRFPAGDPRALAAVVSEALAAPPPASTTADAFPQLFALYREAGVLDEELPTLRPRPNPVPEPQPPASLLEVV